MASSALPFVIVGHVDHGKSTLIGRLLYDTKSLSPDKMAEVEAMSTELGRDTELAFVLDSLEEERSQNITIETTQVFFRSDGREYVIIDAPGHVEFIKNMITGASQAQAAVVIVAAEEGIEEQTRRHSYVLSLLDIRQIAVVINKMDKVGYAEARFRELRDGMEQFLASIGRQAGAIIAISAREGDNVARRSDKMPWYQGPTLLEQLARFKREEQDGNASLRFPVQDVYKIGDKRILAGRVERGTVRVGQDLVFMPGGSRAKVKSIEVFLKDGLQEASEGQSIGLTLDKPLFVERGQVAFPAGDERPPVAQVQAKVFWMRPEPLKMDEPLVLRCATQSVEIKAIRIDRRIHSATLEVLQENASTLGENEVGEVVITTRTPVIVEPLTLGGELGRFVLTRQDDVVAGGIVTSL
jgi:sulfate adenylyltransferase large subunit